MDALSSTLILVCALAGIFTLLGIAAAVDEGIQLRRKRKQRQ
jgi:hypothetical protein